MKPDNETSIDHKTWFEILFVELLVSKSEWFYVQIIWHRKFQTNILTAEFVWIKFDSYLRLNEK